jgi:hypothetical protein
MWQAEQGNVLKAKDDLEKVRLICGTACRAYLWSRTPLTAPRPIDVGAVRQPTAAASVSATIQA